MTIGYGIDLSHFQNPDTLPWESYRGKVNFVIARACYGSRLDERCVEHVRHAREIGAKVGVYSFFRPSLDVDVQFKALVNAITRVGIVPGDIIPALDIEEDTYPTPQPVTPAWSAPTEDFVGRIVALFGDALIYQTQREWRMMGSPAWVLERPLWCAHYSAAASPATPGDRPATIWQHRVGPFVELGPGGSFPGSPQIDQNRLLLPLPLITQTALTEDEKSRIEGLVALTEQQSAEDAIPTNPIGDPPPGTTS
jgi:GH25 family lysozyme M1 (1,4-beta-N-acetylmuramidase)